MILLLLACFPCASHAALTQAQVMEHVGRMMSRGLMTFLDGNEERAKSVQLTDIVGWAKDYRVNSAFGTLADRTEAMQTFQRVLFQNATGRDPANGGKHYYKNHWLDRYAPGESGALEP